MLLDRMRGCFVAVLLTMPLAVASPVLADPKADAKEHIDKAMAAHRAERFSEALDELTVAYTIDPQPDLLYAIAQVHVKLDHCNDAITFYERFLESQPKLGPANAAKEAIAVCNRRIADQKTRPAGTTTTEPTGTTTTTTTTGTTTTTTAPTGTTTQTTVTPTGTTSVTGPVDQPSGSAWYTDPIGGVLVGAGIATGVASIFFYKSATAKLDDAERAPTYDASEKLIDDAHGTRTYAVIAGASAAVLVTLGVIRYVKKRGSEPHVAIAPTTSGGVVTWSGQW